MSAIKLSTPSSGSISLSPANTASNLTITVPAVSGTMLTTASTISASSITTGTLPKAQLPAGSVLQVNTTTKTDTFSSSAANAWTDITGLTVSITPTSSTSRILIMASVQGSNTNTNAYFRFVRNSTAVGVGDGSGSRSQVSSTNIYYPSGNGMTGSSFQFLDSPATTSSTTYKIQFITDGPTTLINRTSLDENALYTGRSQSTITVMEIAG